MFKDENSWQRDLVDVAKFITLVVLIIAGAIGSGIIVGFLISRIFP
jgi:hypothetical protein